MRISKRVFLDALHDVCSLLFLSVFLNSRCPFSGCLITHFTQSGKVFSLTFFSNRRVIPPGQQAHNAKRFG